MATYTEAERQFLATERLLGRVATVGADGVPHVSPVGMWTLAGDGAIEVRGHGFAETKKFRDVTRRGTAAISVDDVQEPFAPRAVLVRGRADAIDGDDPMIRIRPDRVVSWGLEQDDQMPQKESSS